MSTSASTTTKISNSRTLYTFRIRMAHKINSERVILYAGNSSNGNALKQLEEEIARIVSEEVELATKDLKAENNYFRESFGI